MIVTLFPQGDLREGKPVPLKGDVKIFLDGGRFTAPLKGTATPLPNNAFSVKGTAKVTGGNGGVRGRDRLVHVRRWPGDRRDRGQAEARRHNRILGLFNIVGALLS